MVGQAPPYSYFLLQPFVHTPVGQAPPYSYFLLQPFVHTPVGQAPPYSAMSNEILLRGRSFTETPFISSHCIQSP